MKPPISSRHLMPMAAALLAQTAAAFTQMDVSRVLLMNDDTNDVWAVRGQGYFSTNTADEVYWVHSDEEVPAATQLSQALWLLDKTLLAGVTHTLYWRKPGESDHTPLWQLNKCRAGSAATRSNKTATSAYAGGAGRNFVPWSAAHSVAISNDTPMSATAACRVVGMISMLNSTDSWVMSPFYDNLGTIYFDAVNGWTANPGDITLEIATNTVDGTEFTANTPAEELRWEPLPFNVFTVKNKTTVASVANGVTSFTLSQTHDTTDANLWGKFFYRILATVNYRYAPIRFRIRRASIAAAYSSYEEHASAGIYLILDNIIASYAPIQIEFKPFNGIDGKRSYDETGSRRGTQVVGYEGVFSKIFPHVDQTKVRPVNYYQVRDNPYVTNTVPEDFTITKPQFHCRWRYLDQIASESDWKAVELKIYNDTYKTQYISRSSSPPEIEAALSRGPGDLEFYYTFTLTKQPHYEPFDFACDIAPSEAFGTGWTEEISMALTDRCTEKDAVRLGITERTKGRDWFTRIREGESSFRDVILRAMIGDPGSDVRTTNDIPMTLVGDHTWRAFLDEPESRIGKSARIRFHAVESTQENKIYTDVETYWTVPLTLADAPPCSVVAKECEAATADSEWGEIMLDGRSGFLMFEFDDTTHAVSIARCQYQGFNLWTDALDTERGGFVGHSTDTNSPLMTGVSSKKTAYQERFADWSLVKDGNDAWKEDFTVNRGDVGFPTNVWFTTHRTPNGNDTSGWQAENGMFVDESYSIAADTNTFVGLALQMKGGGDGSLTYQDSTPMPKGLGTVTFAARATQDSGFGENYFASYEDGKGFKDYTVGARVAFSNLGAAQLPEKGRPSASLIGYFRSNQGCYELRLTRLSATDVDMALYRWKGKRKCTLLTNKVEKIGYLVTDSGSRSWPPVYLALKTEGDATYMTAAVGDSANTDSMKVNWQYSRFKNHVLSYRDDDDDRCVKGTYGVTSRDCPAHFGRVMRYDTASVNADTWVVTPDLGTEVDDYEELKDEISWSLPDGRMDLNPDSSSAYPWGYMIYACEPNQSVNLRLARVGSGGMWFDSGYSAAVTSFVFSAYSMSPRIVDSYNVRLCTGGSDEDAPADVLIDDVALTQWTTSDRLNKGGDRWDFNQCWVGDIAEFSAPRSYSLNIANPGEFVYTFTNNCDITTLQDLKVTRAYIVSGTGRLNDVDTATLKRNNFHELKAGALLRVTVGHGSNISRLQFGKKDGDWYTANVTGGSAAPNGEKSIVRLYLDVGGNRTAERIAKMQPRRAKPSGPVMIRSPYLEKGISLFSFSYDAVDTNAVLKLQVATNGVDASDYDIALDLDDSRWETVADFTFKTEGEFSGERTCTHFFGWREPVHGYVRLLCDPGVVQETYHDLAVSTNDFYASYPEHGSISLTSLTVYDEPRLDEKSWYGWNMLTTTNSLFSYLPDVSIENGPGLSGVLNFTARASDPDNQLADPLATGTEAYSQHDPFVQAPAITNQAGIGEVQFRARMWDPGTNVASYVCVYGSADPQADDDYRYGDWEQLGDPIKVDCPTFRTFRWKTLDDTVAARYKAVRLVVKGAKEGKDSPNAVARPIQRVVLDEIAVMEPIAPTIVFKSVAPFRTGLDAKDVKPVENAGTMEQQPLLEESFGIQVEVALAQLPDKIDVDSIEVYMSYYTGDRLWGHGQWSADAEALASGEAVLSNKLVRCSGDSSLVWRSAYLPGFENSVIPAQMDPGSGGWKVVQYHVWATFLDTSTNRHEHTVQRDAGEWVNPKWYYPRDWNRDNGGYADKGKFCPYTVLQNVSPRRAWINCVNVYDGDLNNPGPCQFMELTVPVDTDMTSWYLRFTERDETDEWPDAATPFAYLGGGDIAARKAPTPNTVDAAWEFLAVQSPARRAAGKAADGTWNAFRLNNDSAANGTFTANRPYGLELLRPNGIIEHQLVFAGTNIYLGAYGPDNRYAKRDMPETVCADLRSRDGESIWVCAGYDSTDGTLGVMSGHGAEDGDWNGDLESTPMAVNRKKDGTSQVIEPGWNILPGGMNCWVFSYLHGGYMSQTSGEESGDVIRLLMQKGSSTNITYKVEPWHRIGSFKSNNVEVAAPPFNAAARTYEYHISGITSNITLSVTSCVAPDIYNDETKLDPSDRYNDAIVHWLERLSADRPDGGESRIIPAELVLKGREGAYDPETGKHLSLKEMYWLNISPFDATNRLVVGLSAPQLIPLPESYIEPLSAHPTLTNIRFRVYMMITNCLTGDARAPNMLQGLGGESSANYTANWTSETFRVRGKLFNADFTEIELGKWRPLRYFVFKEDSFVPKGEPDEFTAELDVWDPFSDKTPFYSSETFNWWPYRGKGILWFSTSVDDKDNRPVTIEPLKTTNPL